MTRVVRPGSGGPLGSLWVDDCTLPLVRRGTSGEFLRRKDYSYSGSNRATIARPSSARRCSNIPLLELIFMVRGGSKNHDLFVPQSLDGIEARSLPRGIDSESDSDQCTEYKRRKDPESRQVGRHVNRVFEH